MSTPPPMRLHFDDEAWSLYVTSPARRDGWVECTTCKRPCIEDEIKQLRIHKRDGLTLVQVLCEICVAAERLIKP